VPYFKLLAMITVTVGPGTKARAVAASIKAKRESVVMAVSLA